MSSYQSPKKVLQITTTSECVSFATSQDGKCTNAIAEHDQQLAKKTLKLIARSRYSTASILPHLEVLACCLLCKAEHCKDKRFDQHEMIKTAWLKRISQFRMTMLTTHSCGGVPGFSLSRSARANRGPEILPGANSSASAAAFVDLSATTRRCRALRVRGEETGSESSPSTITASQSHLRPLTAKDSLKTRYINKLRRGIKNRSNASNESSPSVTEPTRSEGNINSLIRYIPGPDQHTPATSLLPGPVTIKEEAEEDQNLEEPECGICLEHLEDKTPILICKEQCQQKFHQGCMDSWLASLAARDSDWTCPYWYAFFSLAPIV